MLDVKTLARRGLALPPLAAVRRRLYERQFASGKTEHIFRGVFTSFREALDSAPGGELTGYDNRKAASLYRNRPIFPEDYPVLFWLLRLVEPSSQLFDFGGHAGGMFDAFRRLLPTPAFAWRIFDVAAVVEAGRELNAMRQPPVPEFTTNWNDASGADILLASGSLQYVETPLAVRLSELAELPRHVLVNQLPLHDDMAFFTLQRIGNVFCPYGIFRRDAFYRSLQELGYAVVDTWDNPGKACYVPTYPRHCVKSYSGAYLRLQP